MNERFSSSHWIHRWRVLGLSVLFLGAGPFQCADRDLESARDALESGEPQTALEYLEGHAVDIPEFHLARAVAHLSTEPSTPGEGGVRCGRRRHRGVR